MIYQRTVDLPLYDDEATASMIEAVRSVGHPRLHITIEGETRAEVNVALRDLNDAFRSLGLDRAADGLARGRRRS